MPEPIDPHHNSARAVFRFLGPGIALVGLVFTIVGLGSFFSSLGTFEPPRYFWCAIVGLPLIGLGMAISKFAFLGAITRYMGNEIAPVGKDMANYMAAGTKGAVRDVASAVAEGLRAGASAGSDPAARCSACDANNEASAKYCKACGAPLATTKPCPSCGEANDPDARFCDNCGKAVA